MAPKRVVVLSATTTQCASVIRSLLEDRENEWEVVGISHNPVSLPSQDLVMLGAKIHKGDLDHPETYEPVLKGAHAVFLSCDFWKIYDGTNAEEAKAREIKQGKAAIEACKRQDVGHFIYSTLESIKSQATPHLDSKAEITHWLKKSELPYTLIYTSFAMRGILRMNYNERDDEKILVCPLPDDTVIPAFAAEQTGGWVRPVVRNPQQYAGQSIYCCGENLTIGQLADTLSEVLETKFDTLHRTRQQFMDDKNTDAELWKTYMGYLNNEVKRDPQQSKRVNPDAWDLKTWAKHNERKLRHHFDC